MEQLSESFKVLYNNDSKNQDEEESHLNLEPEPFFRVNKHDFTLLLVFYASST